MKVRVEIIETSAQEEVVIRCRRIDESIMRLQQTLSRHTVEAPRIVFYKGNREFYLLLDEILFFETEKEHVYAHTVREYYDIKFKLYELERILPSDFVRIAKSTIVNIRQIHSITKNITSASKVEFCDSDKHVYVSRHYYQMLREKLQELRL
ncbi:MAG: LytR/AlgR family response regulator transcription factor [Lachnospiraceae bacterium]